MSLDAMCLTTGSSQAQQRRPARSASRHGAMTAKIARAALARAGVKARPLPCGIAVMNPAAVELHDAGVPIAEWPASAWSVGVDPDSTDDVKPGQWNGHLCVAGDGWIGDFSAAQFARPGLIDVHAWVSPVPDGWRNHDITVANQTNRVTVTVRPRPELARWRSTNAWRSPIPSDWVDALWAKLVGEGVSI